MTSSRVVLPSEVPEDSADVIDAAIQRSGIPDSDPRNSVQPWYHDEPTWLLVSPEDPDGQYRAMQATVVQDAGRLWLEVHSEIRRIVGRDILMAATIEPTRLALDELREQPLAETLKALWDAAPAPPAEPTDIHVVGLSSSISK